MNIRAVFVDRDGTINVEKNYVFRIEDFDYIPGAVAALRMATDRHVKIYIVTNQAGIAKGRFTEDDFRKLTHFMLDDLKRQGVAVADVLFCPHHPEATVPAYRQACDCRKPGTALLRAVIEKEGFSLDNVALIGDKNSDVEAGRRLGMRTYLVETGYGAEEKASTRADFVVADLKAAMTHLLSNGDRQQ